jgi:2EXR family
MTSLSSTAPAGFSRFQQLPPELRIKIWRDALPSPRTIHLVREAEGIKTCVPYQPRRLVPKRCAPTVPYPRDLLALLQACAESRHEVLARYEPLLVPKVPADPVVPIHYFDPLRDGIFVDQVWPWVRGALNKPSGVFKTRCLSISCNTWWAMWIHRSPQLFGKCGLLRFKQLDELHIVFRILADHEKERLPFGKAVFGPFSGVTRSSFLVQGPKDIEFPHPGVDIHAEPIREVFELLKEANPDWNVPKLKLIAWATSPPGS